MHGQIIKTIIATDIWMTKLTNKNSWSQYGHSILPDVLLTCEAKILVMQKEVLSLVLNLLQQQSTGIEKNTWIF